MHRHATLLLLLARALSCRLDTRKTYNGGNPLVRELTQYGASPITHGFECSKRDEIAGRDCFSPGVQERFNVLS